MDLFGLSAAENSVLAEWPEAQRLAGERETLGLFLSGHPITPYEQDLKFLVSARLADVGGPKPPAAVDGARGWTAGKATTVAGLVLEIRRRPNRVTLILDDRSARLEVSLYEEVFQQHRDISGGPTAMKSSSGNSTRGHRRRSTSHTGMEAAIVISPAMTNVGRAPAREISWRNAGIASAIATGSHSGQIHTRSVFMPARSAAPGNLCGRRDCAGRASPRGLPRSAGSAPVRFRIRPAWW